MVAHWTAGQQVKGSILHLGHDLYQSSSCCPRLSPVHYSLTVQICGLKHYSFQSFWAFFLFCFSSLFLFTSHLPLFLSLSPHHHNIFPFLTTQASSIYPNSCSQLLLFTSLKFHSMFICSYFHCGIHVKF